MFRSDDVGRNVEDATRRMKNININTAGMGIKAIQEKLDGLERQLAMAIERQDFECCVDLKPRISVLKGMLERGQPVDPSELDAI